jgi:hypothetical protein
MMRITSADNHQADPGREKNKDNQQLGTEWKFCRRLTSNLPHTAACWDIRTHL